MENRKKNRDWIIAAFAGALLGITIHAAFLFFVSVLSNRTKTVIVSDDFYSIWIDAFSAIATISIGIVTIYWLRQHFTAMVSQAKIPKQQFLIEEMEKEIDALTEMISMIENGERHGNYMLSISKYFEGMFGDKWDEELVDFEFEHPGVFFKRIQQACVTYNKKRRILRNQEIGADVKIEFQIDDDNSCLHDTLRAYEKFEKCKSYRLYFGVIKAANPMVQEMDRVLLLAQVRRNNIFDVLPLERAKIYE